MFLVSYLSAPKLTIRAISRLKGISNIGNHDDCPSKWEVRIKTGGPPKRRIKVEGFRSWGRSLKAER
jgi:hypothetical protein